MVRLKASGERGDWFTVVEGERLPCVHKFWMNGPEYRDPGYINGEKYWEELVFALKTGRKAVLTDGDHKIDPSKKSGVQLYRKIYIAIFEIDDVKTDENGLHFTFVRRLHELK